MKTALRRPNHRIHQSRSDKIFQTINVVLCLLIIICIAYPLYFVVIASISDPDLVASGSVWLWPKGVTWSAYEKLLSTPSVWTGYLNTILYTVGFTAISLLVTMPAAYALSRKDFPLRGLFMIFFLIPMFLDGGMITKYLQMKNLGLLDSYWAMVLPTAANVFNIIIARTYYSTQVPRELQEAAELDGCGDFRFFVKIVIPLTTTIIAIIALYAAVESWNSYMNALVYLESPEKRPLQLILRSILIENQLSATTIAQAAKQAQLLKYALVVVSSLPIMCGYPFIQKYFTKGVMIGSLKG